MNPKIARFLAEHQPATPCLVLDVDRVEDNFRALRRTLPLARIYYAVKANPAPQILERLVGLSSFFDAAGFEEVAACLDAGARPEAISYGNTIKKASAIRAAFERGVTLFAFDSLEELRKLAEHAPGARVYCRLLVENKGADWPLSRKFGTTVENAKALMLRAGAMGLDPYGLSFHVGSQQTTTRAYEVAIAKVAMLFTDLTEAGVNLRMMNLGGGFPVRYKDDVPEIDQFGDAIMTALVEHFGNNLPEMVIEPSSLATPAWCRPRSCWCAGASRRIRCAGSTWISAGSADWRKPKAKQFGIASQHRMMAARPGRWRSPVRPVTAWIFCTRSRTTGCRWR